LIDSQRARNTSFEDYEKSNKITSGATLIVPTTGNLGISLALLAQKKGHRVIAVVPERTTYDRIHLLKALGVEILRAPNEARREANESPYSVAEKLAKQLNNAVVIDESTSAPREPYLELAEEIFQQAKNDIDYLICGVESGATITALANELRAKIPHIKVVGVEPHGSIIGDNTVVATPHSQNWKIEDLGNNFVPTVLEKGSVDKWVKVSDKAAFSTARQLIRDEGMLCGISSGAVVSAALDIAHKLSQHTTHTPRMVVVLNDTARNYSATLLSDEWLLENDLMDDLTAKKLEYLRSERYRAVRQLLGLPPFLSFRGFASVEDLQLPAAVTISPSAPLSQAFDLMLEREYSQLPVIHSSNKKLVGCISLASVKAHLEDGSAQGSDPVSRWMFHFGKQGKGEKYEVITPDTPLATLGRYLDGATFLMYSFLPNHTAKFFEKNSFAVITDEQRRWCLGVATKYDLISFLNRRNNLIAV
ncbi:tryptophan synthase beta subunit-like PLP-dependent enzyme, partial [Jimgerdemannia flammicorona]